MKNNIAKQSMAAHHVKANPFKLRLEEVTFKEEPIIHTYKIHSHNVICDTEARGYPTPRNLNPREIVLDAPGGVIPLWEKGVTLQWRFQKRSMSIFEDVEAAKDAIEQLLIEAIMAWGDAVPVKFSKHEDAWDFEIVVRSTNQCRREACVLASAFFPDNGRHKLVIYPKIFEQSREEQVETLIHELGHVFGLRHFFAKVSESAWPSKIYGSHNPFSIMNYGHESELSNNDKADLKKLYQLAWSRELTDINGTPIRFVKPFHTLE